MHALTVYGLWVLWGVLAFSLGAFAARRRR